jgi:ubiquinone/menaquinone biosynthesis C-methylase UbiE
MYKEDKTTYNDDWWHIYSKAMNSNDILAIHFGHFEKGIRTHKQAVINKNKFVENLLELDNFKKKGNIILDAGCGVGGTSIFLAKKYPHINFIGLNISPGQIFLAKKFAQQYSVSNNADFIVGDFLSIGIINNYFDGIFAIQSVNRVRDKKKLLKEFSRVLKPDKKIIIDDIFLTKKPSKHFLKLAYNLYCKKYIYSSIETLEDFKSYLVDSGFDNIKAYDITKKFWLTFYITGLKWFIFRINFRRKKITESVENEILINKKNSILNNLFINFFIETFIPIPFILNRSIRMMTITAVKK